ncbi:MAG: PAS domain S-box protein [Bacteroidota bacterium]
MKQNKHSEPEILRYKAEEFLRNKPPVSTSKLSEADMVKLIYELEVHQVELEMQNEELREARYVAKGAAEKYTNLYEFAPAGYFTLSRDGRILEINLSGTQMIGNTRSHLQNSLFDFHVSKETRPVFELFLKRVFNGKAKESCEVTFAGEGNLPVYVHLAGVSADDGKHCLLTAVDISERKRDENSLKAAEEKYRKNSTLLNSLLESPVDIIIFALDKNYCYTTFTKSHQATMQKIWGAEIAVGANMLEFISNPDDRRKARENFDRAMQGDFFSMVEEYGDKGLSRIFYEDVYSPIKDSDGKVAGVSVFVIDITRRKLAEAQANQIASIVQSSEDAIIGKNMDGIILSWNKGAEKIYGYTESEAVGKSVSILVPEETDDEVPAILTRLKSGQVIKHYETSRRRKDGRNIQVSLTISPIVDADGRIIAASSIARDITERKLAEKALQESRKELVYIINQLAIAQQTGHVGSWNFNLSTGKINGSAEAQRLFGLFDRDNTFDLQHIEDCIPDRQRVHQALVDLITKETPYNLEYVIHPADGSAARVIVSKATLEKDAAGNPVSVNGIVQDITENKLVQEKLLSQTMLLEAQLNSTIDGILIVGKDNRRLLINRRMIELFKVPADIIKNKNDIDLLRHVTALTKDPDKFLEKIMFLNENPDKESSDEIAFKDGMVIDRYSAPVIGKDGANYGRIWIFRDVTERKLADALFRDIIEKNPMSIQILSMEGFTTQTNPAHTKLFGVKTPADYSIFKDPQLLKQGMGELFEKVKQGETVYFPDSRFNVHDVDPLFPDIMTWIKAVGFTLQGENGAPARVVLMHENITERKHAEEMFHAIIEKNPMSIQIVDKEGFTMDGNPAYVKLFGAFPPPGFSIFADLQSKSPELEKLILLAKQGNIVHLPDIYYNPNDVSPDLPDNPVWIRALIFPLNDCNGKLDRYVFMHENITQRKLAEQELIKTKERAEESDRLKSAFLANMSHEIRTPMNGILGFAGLLKEPGLNGEEQQKYIRIIEKSGARMLNIINDIVDISKIEAGQMEVAFSNVNVNEVTEAFYTFFKPEAEIKGIRLILKKSLPAKDAVIITDCNKFDSILSNLIKNAIKYTHTGSIEFGYTIAGTPPGISPQPGGILPGTFLQFFVKDTGIGIPKQRQEAIFERFIQADISDKQALQGAGLGLSIAKAYVEMLGGKIWVESEQGKGSEFYFSVPYNTGKPKNSAITKAVVPGTNDTQIKNLKILVVEDDEISDLYIETLMNQISSEILHTETGTEAIRIFSDTPGIDLVLMDMKMPGMDGFEATRQIRRLNKDVIIIAQTAYGLSGDREKALAAGCNDYISKPIKKEELLALVQKYLNK